MILSKIKNNIRKKLAEKNAKKNATLIGEGQKFSAASRIILQDNAKKENVILEKGVWALGSIYVQDKGKVFLHEYSKIDSTTKIMCVNKIDIGAYTAIAHNTTICDNNNHPVCPSFRRKMRITAENSTMRLWKYSDNAPIIIGENCWIGTNVRICKGVTIGDNSVIAAGSIVTKNVPANCIAAGNPAKIVKTDIDKLPEPIID